MGSTTDEPEAIEKSIHMADSSTTSTVTSSSPTVSAPPKRSKRGGRKGSLMFTPGGSVGLGAATNIVNANNIKLPHKNEAEKDEGASTILSYTVESSTTDPGLDKKQEDTSSGLDKDTLHEAEAQPAVLTTNSIRSKSARKGSLMFTSSGTVGLGANNEVKTPVSVPAPAPVPAHVSDPEKPLEINTTMQSPQSSTQSTEAAVHNNGKYQPPVASQKVRKGSLMFTGNGTVGLGSKSNMASPGADPTTQPDISAIASSTGGTKAPTVTFQNNGNEYLGDVAPITYYTQHPTMPPNYQTNAGRPITYFTQPAPTPYIDPMSLLPPMPQAFPPMPPQLLSGENHLKNLLKFEIEGNSRALSEYARRGSCVVTSGGIGGLNMNGFEDSSSDEEYQSKRKTGSLPGMEDYRPFVGGFAAAAYEASKAHHYKAKQRALTSTKEIDDDENLPRLPPPSI